MRDAKAGAFERWRLINAGTGETMRMRLYRLDPAAPPLRTVRGEEQIAWRERYCTGQPLPMWQIALDGLTRSAVRKVDEAILFAGERMDVIARLPGPGLYCMVNDTSRNDTEKRQPVAHGGVDRGERRRCQRRRCRRLAAVHAGPMRQRKRWPESEQSAVRARVVDELKDGLKLSSFIWHKPIPEEEVSGYREVILNIVDGPEETAFRVNGRTYDHNRIDAVLPLGKAEEWRAIALIEDHPLHIHVNPFQIVSIEDPRRARRDRPEEPGLRPRLCRTERRVEGHGVRQEGHARSRSAPATSASPATSSSTATSCSTATMA